MNHGLSIVPKKNMITNVGYDNGTHSSAEFDKIPDYLKKIYTLKRYEITLPLKHPKVVEENKDYKKRVYKMMKWNTSQIRRIKDSLVYHLNKELKK